MRVGDKPGLFPLTACFKAFARDEGGATAIEYAVIATGISIAVAGVVMSIGSTLNTMYFGEVNDGLK